MERRRFLRSSGLALLGGLIGRAAWARTTSSPSRSLIVQSLRPENLATPIEWFDRLLTPSDVFFVRSHFGAPRERPRSGRVLSVEGLVQHPRDLRLDELEAMPQVTVTAVLQCAGNGRAFQMPRVPGVQWTHGAMGQAEWTGVRLRDLLEGAGLANGAAHVGIEGTDLPLKPSVPSYYRSIPLERAMDPTTLVALRMNGRPLTHAHGAPLRLVVPAWSGNHWLKWLRTIRAQEKETPGFYMQTGYRLPRHPVEPGAAVPPEDTVPVTTLPIKSVIARPTDGSRLTRGRHEVVGVAFSGEAPIGKVEVSLDEGASWRTAVLEGDPGLGRWQVFRLLFDARPGRMGAIARAMDREGRRQPEHAEWNPSGYFWNGWHSVAWDVA